MLERSGIPVTFAGQFGVRSIASAAELPESLGVHTFGGVPGLLFPWKGPDGELNYQLRPDEPAMDKDGRPQKYLQGSGVHLLNVVGDLDDAREIWVVEGTKQSLSAAAHADLGVLVVGIPGCWNWMHDGQILRGLADLVEDKPIVVFFDADVSTNASVWRAASTLRDALELEGAARVGFVTLPGSGKTGLDDVLGSRPAEKRQKFLRRLADKAGALPQSPPSRRTSQRDDSGRPMIDVAQDRLALINATLQEMLSRWDGWRLFNHGGVISELTERGEIRALDRGRLLDVLAQTAHYYRSTRYGPVSAWPDNNAILAAAAGEQRFTPLERVSRVPFVRADGTICQDSGYDQASRTFLLLDDNLGRITVPPAPSRAEIDAAVALLMDEWFGDMPLAEPADRANLLGLVLTPFVRGLVPLAPLGVVDGLQMGVGKNLLADCVALLGTGRNADPLLYPSDEEEQRKVITSTFGTGADLFVFDEAHSIGGKPLARALTATTYSDRILGVSRMASYPNTVTWIALGNQVQVHGDLARRVYRISLRPTAPDPDRRDNATFRHPDLRQWTRANRGRLVQAALTLVQAWFAAGQPTAPTGVSFGSFEAWERTVGGILHTAGVEGFLANTRQWRSEADFESSYWEEHLRDLWHWNGEDSFTVAEVVTVMKARDSMAMPPQMDDCTGHGFPRQLGQAYAKVRDRWYGAYCLRRDGTPGHGGGHGNVNRWRMEKREDPPPPRPELRNSGPATTTPQSPDGKDGASKDVLPPADSTGLGGSGGSEGSPPSLRLRQGQDQRASSEPHRADVVPVVPFVLDQGDPPDPPVPPTVVDLDASADAERRAAALDLIAATLTTTGLRVDMPLVRRRVEDSDRRANDLRGQLIRDYGFPALTSSGEGSAQPWSSTAGRQHLRELVAGSSWPAGADGHPATDLASLNTVIAGPYEEDVRDLATIIAALQSPQTFLREIAKHVRSQRVHPDYSAATATGRWTSSRPNVLGAGRRNRPLLTERDVVLAEPGHMFIGVDLAGIDARCVAGLSGDSTYAEHVTRKDPHGEIARMFFGSPEDRAAAKAITHGLNYGRGARSIARQTGRPVAQVEHLIRHYFETFPKVASWQHTVRATALAHGMVPTGTGRHVLVDPARAHTTAPARVAQAAARDLAAIGLMRLEGAGLLPNLRLFLHDEVVLSVPRADAEDIVTQVAELMSFRWRSPSGLIIPIHAAPHPHLGSRWSDLYIAQD